MLRSVDMQQILLQTTAIEKVQQVQQQHADVEKKHFALQLQEEMDQRKKEVQDTKESEEAKIREEEERKKKQKREYKADSSEDEEGKDNPKKEKLLEMDQGKILDLIV